MRDAVTALSLRLDQVVSTWRAHLRDGVGIRPGARSPARPGASEIEAARASLQHQLAEVVDEAARIRTRARHEHDAATAWETRAMLAVQRDDQAATVEALEQHGLHFAVAITLDDELRILDAMAETCRQALDEGSIAPSA